MIFYILDLTVTNIFLHFFFYVFRFLVPFYYIFNIFLILYCGLVKLLERVDYFMVNIAFCFEHDSDLNFMENEISKCFHQRGICISTNRSHNAQELKNNIRTCYPDILFCELDSKNDIMYKVILSIKKHNPKLVSIISKNNDYNITNTDSLIEPVFTVPDKSRKQLWAYATLAYETAIKDDNSFAYYRRPCYVYTSINDILYFASEGRRTFLFSNDGCDTFYKKLDEVEQLVQNKSCEFLRIHKSFLVNINYISSYNRYYIKLCNGERLRISNYYYYKKINEKLKASPAC